MASGRLIVASPAFNPAGFGLLSVAQDLSASVTDRHWQAGVIWEPLCAAAGTTYDECLAVTGVAAVAEPEAKSATFDHVRRAATPFTVYARKDCTPVGFWDDAAGEVSEAITEGEGWQVERAFWTGLAGGGTGVVHPHLAADTELVSDSDVLQLAATSVTGVPVDLIEGIGRLEGALADCYQGVGVLHVPVGLAANMAYHGLLVRDGARYRTPAGNAVALGRGYPGTSPAGVSTAGVSWVYATGAVFYLRSALRSVGGAAGLNRSVNTLEQLSERTYVVGWDCCLLAIPISLGGEPAGAFNATT